MSHNTSIDYLQAPQRYAILAAIGSLGEADFPDIMEFLTERGIIFSESSIRIKVSGFIKHEQLVEHTDPSVHAKYRLTDGGKEAVIDTLAFYDGLVTDEESFRVDGEDEDE